MYKSCKTGCLLSHLPVSRWQQRVAFHHNYTTLMSQAHILSVLVTTLNGRGPVTSGDLYQDFVLTLTEDKVPSLKCALHRPGLVTSARLLALPLDGGRAS